MKITTSIQKAYNDASPVAEKLKEKVDTLIAGNKKPSWHYLSRVKHIESYALKLETGRFKDYPYIEDLLGCTIVVENLNEMRTALSLVQGLFTIKERRPRTDDSTHKSSSSFEFDDLRLYVSLKEEYLPENIRNFVFEFQIKTFLQHAWAIATHDLIYKSDRISWSKQRVAYQVKAMLEQAEVAISGVDSLAMLPELAKTNRDSNTLNEFLDFILETFPRDQLPKDLLRLSKILSETLPVFDISLDQLKTILDTETKAGRGVEILNLSPYGIILSSIINQEKNSFERAFTSSTRYKGKVFVPSEIDISTCTIQDPTKMLRS